ncbi:MAG: histidine kinase [Flavobacteriaceae bacterium]|nr:histidine kinase [Flavobacteriaceae bacterium]
MNFSEIVVKNKFLQHLIFWTLLFLIYILSYAGNKAYYLDYTENVAIKFPFYIIAAYSFNYWQVPRLLNKKKNLAFVLSLIFVSFLLFVGFRYVLHVLHGNEMKLLNIPSYLSKTIMFYPPALMIYTYQTLRKQQQEKDRLLLLQQEKLSTELKYLKAQLNPHFLFNTLNNLYSYIINKSPRAGDMVLQLSEILNYVLYKSQKDQVDITEEIDCIQHYIELEKIRYGDRLKVSLEKPEKILKQGVTPLLLLSLVENAFKHGVGKSISNPEIKISLKQDQNLLIFNVWNTKDIQHDDIDNKGIGLRNIKRQLNLIYPKNHQLKIDGNKSYFNVNLLINIP